MVVQLIWPAMAYEERGGGECYGTPGVDPCTDGPPMPEEPLEPWD